MEKAEILHFENDPLIRRLAKHILADSNHTIVAAAHSRPGALALLEQVKADNLRANTILLDAQISELEGDPNAILKRVEELDLKLRVIGLASLPMKRYGVEVDIDLTKSNIGFLVETLDNLPEPGES